METSLIRAAMIDRPGALPRIIDTVAVDRAPHHTRVEVAAAALNPLDIGIASGLIPYVRHEASYVPGLEAVGRVSESDRFRVGQLVYVETHPGPDAPGCLAAEVVVSDANVSIIPPGTDAAAAVAVGNAGVAAYVPLIDLAALQAGESVLILGATGAVGRLAVQVARAHGAGRIVAVGRDPGGLERVQSLGADAVVQLRSGESAAQLAARLAGAGDSPDVVLDALCGVPLEAALQVVGAGARVVNIGSSADLHATLTAQLLRSKRITVMGFASFTTPHAQKQPALQWFWSQLVANRLVVDVDTCALEDLPSAWARQQSAGHAKTVVVPQRSLPSATLSRRRP